MSVAQQTAQDPASVSPNESGGLSQERILETLTLHGNAINTALQRLLALEARLGISRAKPAAAPESAPVFDRAPILADLSRNGRKPSTGPVTEEGQALQGEVSKIKWYHSIDLGDGIITPGSDPSAEQLVRMHLPESLEGLTFLDIGAWDGFYSFEAERRGAKRVLATDGYIWLNKAPWASKAGFDLAKRVLKSQVEEMELDVMDASPEKIGMFDVVLFAGVLYHLRHPLMALERVFSVTKKLMILETYVDLNQVKRPMMAFYPNDELVHDPTNWWGPNTSCVLAMCKSAGFRNARVVSEFVTGNARSVEETSYGRVVVHAQR